MTGPTRFALGGIIAVVVVSLAIAKPPQETKMPDYTIRLNMMDTAMRAAVDAAVHAAIARFRDELGDNAELTRRIAKAAATNALEQFKTWCNAELRLLEVEHDRRAQELMLRPPRPFLVDSDKIDGLDTKLP